MALGALVVGPDAVAVQSGADNVYWMSGLKRSVTCASAVAAVALGVLGAVVVGPGDTAVVEASNSLGSGGETHIIDPPRRILDTRPTSSINDRDRPGPKALSALNSPGERFEV